MSERTIIATEQEQPVTMTVGQTQYISVTAVSGLIQEMMGPLFVSINQALTQQAEAMRVIGQQQQAQAMLLENLEKEVRESVKIDSTQATHLNSAIKDRAAFLLAQYKINDKKLATKLGGVIRKSLMIRYGVRSVRDISKYEYQVAMRLVSSWLDVVKLNAVMQEGGDDHGQT